MILNSLILPKSPRMTPRLTSDHRDHNYVCNTVGRLLPNSKMFELTTAGGTTAVPFVNEFYCDLISIDNDHNY